MEGGIMEFVGYGVMLAVNLATLAYGYGILHGRVKTLESRSAEFREDDTEIFARLRALENITPRLEDATMRLERALSNGIIGRMGTLETRIALIEQHCKDTHSRILTPSDARNTA